MNFIEFIEAMVRVAQNLEIPHLLYDEDSFVGMELEVEQREVYEQRELHQKVESLILYLVRVHLPRNEFRKYCAILKAYKEEEDIWANDIESGNLRAV